MNLCLLCWQSGLFTTERRGKPGTQAFFRWGDLDGFSVLRTLPCFQKDCWLPQRPQLTSSWARLDRKCQDVGVDISYSWPRGKFRLKLLHPKREKVSLMVKTVVPLSLCPQPQADPLGQIQPLTVDSSAPSEVGTT